MNTTSLMVAGYFYVVPKIGAYMTTRPEQQPPENRIDRLREHLADFYEINLNRFDRRSWSILTGHFVDNAWAAYLIYSYLEVRSCFLTPFQGYFFAPVCFLTFCSGVYAARLVAAKFLLPSLGYCAYSVAKLIAPREEEVN